MGRLEASRRHNCRVSDRGERAVITFRNRHCTGYYFQSISGARREAASGPDRGRAGEADQGVHLHLLPAAAPRVRHVRQLQGHLLPLPLLHQRPSRLPRPGHRHSSGESWCPLECQLYINLSDPLNTD